MIATLQSLRFVFVMLIFLSHFAYKDIRAFDAGGDCGVAFFFILSGFVLSIGYGEQIRKGLFDYRLFLKRRLLKSYPLHIFCLLFFLIVSRSTIDGKVALNALLLQSWVPDAEYYFSCNSVSWFLSSLLFCYLLFPWTYRWVSSVMTLAVLVVCLLVYVVTPYERVNAILYVNPLVRFVDFYLGMVLARYFLRWHGCRGAEWLLVVGLLIVLAIYPMMDEKWRNAPLYWLVLIPLIGVFAQQRGWLSRVLQAKPMLFLGSLSLPLYLTHQMLTNILTNHLPEMSAVSMLAICVLVTLTVSWMIQIIFSRLLRLLDI